VLLAGAKNELVGDAEVGRPVENAGRQRWQRTKGFSDGLHGARLRNRYYGREAEVRVVLR
jgi:hypothetical protein